MDETATTRDPWEGPYVPPLGEREQGPIPGGWPLVFALAGGLAGLALVKRWWDARGQAGRKTTRQLAGQLRQLGEPLTAGERRLLNTSLRKVSRTERERLLSQPEAMRAHIEAYPGGDAETRAQLSRKLVFRVPERTEGLLAGTRVTFQVEGFPGHFEGMVRESTPDVLTLDLMLSSEQSIHFRAGDLFTVRLDGVYPERAFKTRVQECGKEGSVPVCRLGHGDIVTLRRS